MTPSRRVAACFVALTLAGSSAFAQEPAPSPAALQGLFDRAVELSRAERHDEAIALYEQVLRHDGEPRVRRNLALAYRARGRDVEAVEQLDRYLAAPLPEDRDHLRELHTLLEDLRARLASVAVRVAPASAELRVDGRARPGARELSLTAGPHTLELTSPGHRPLRRELDLRPGQRAELDVTLEALPVLALLRVVPTPDQASIAVDGHPRGTGVVALELAPGAHLVEASAPSHQGARRAVTLGPGQTLLLDLQLARLAEPTPARPRWAMPVAIASSVVVVAGVVAAVLALTLDREQPAPARDPASLAPDWGTFRMP